MIPEASIEAAARALARHRWPTALEVWDSFGQGMQDDYRDTARAALEAATPSIWASAYARALDDAATLIEPFSGIGLANGATRGDVARWLRDRAEEIRPSE